MKEQMIRVNKGFRYDDETYIEAGSYEVDYNGTNGYPMIKVNGEWLDICDIEAL